MSYLTGILLTLFLAVIVAGINDHKIAQRIRQHLERWGNLTNPPVGPYVAGFAAIFTRFFLLVCISFLQTWIRYDWNVEYPNGLLYLAGVVIMNCAIFMFCFNGSLNLMRNHPWTYVSVDNGKWSDEIFKGSYFRQLSAIVAFIGLGLGLSILA